MMREIKFRAWDKEDKCWVKEPDVHFFINYYTDHPQSIFLFGNTTSNMSLEHRYILMQYTGLKDKNGKEIYEGDIVKGRLGIVLGEVKSGKYKMKRQNKHHVPRWHLGWYIQDKREQYGLEWAYWYIDNYLHPIRKDYLEVIGNIYENPELLEGKEKELEEN
jgi:uncharacterized phage protein (TIGR01671 family)